VALVATLGKGEEEKIIGVGRYSVLPTAGDAPRSAEIAFSVVDEYQNHGVRGRCEHLQNSDSPVPTPKSSSPGA
jgi:hypothetical protein